jgi:hypothetical protein
MTKRYQVVVAIPDEKNGIVYATLSHKDKIQFCKRTAEKYAREYKAKHMRDAWIEESFCSGNTL